MDTGRPLRRLLALLMLAAVLVGSGCGGGSGEITIAQLAQSQQDYVGQRVTTRGVVRYERDPDGRSYYVLADAHGVLVGLDPAGSARAFEGRAVQVIGVFEVQEGFGRVIHIAAITPSTGGTG